MLTPIPLQDRLRPWLGLSNDPGPTSEEEAIAAMRFLLPDRPVPVCEDDEGYRTRNSHEPETAPWPVLARVVAHAELLDDPPTRMPDEDETPAERRYRERGPITFRGRRPPVRSLMSDPRPPERRESDRDRFVQILRAWSEAHDGRTPTVAEWHDHARRTAGAPGTNALVFVLGGGIRGTWNRAMITAGLTPRPRQAAQHVWEEGRRRGGPQARSAHVSHWTPEEDQAVLSSRPLLEIAAETGRTRAAVATRRTLLRKRGETVQASTGRPGHSHWADWELALLRSPLETWEIAEITGRTEHAIHLQRWKQRRKETQ